MATVRLHVSEIDGERLPDVCMHCGARPVTYREQEFWTAPRPTPSTVALILLFGYGMLVPILFKAKLDDYDACYAFFLALSGVVVVAVLSNLVAFIWPNRMLLSMPLCIRHRRSWAVRTWGRRGVLWMTLLVVGGIGWRAIHIESEWVRLVVVGCLAIGIGGAIVLADVVILLVYRHGIHTLELTRSEITLTGVSPVFVLAVDEYREERVARLESNTGRRLYVEEDGAPADRRIRPAPGVAREEGRPP
jgi:hypothetical protein